MALEATNARPVLALVLAVLFAAVVALLPTATAHSGAGSSGASPGGNPNAGCHQQDDTTGGPYDANCTGAPSENGNGEGGQSGPGRPCAGCVGNADNQQPPGQLPGGSDGNAGYECDSNQGIGRGNPAHTGCSPAPTTTPSVTPSTTPSTTPSVTPSTTPSVTPSVTPSTTPSVRPSDTQTPRGTPRATPTTPGNGPAPEASETPPLGEQIPPRPDPDLDTQPSGPDRDEVLGERISRAPNRVAPQAVAAPVYVAPERVGGAQLPFTGAPLVPLVAVGILALTSGSTLLWFGRRDIKQR